MKKHLKALRLLALSAFAIALSGCASVDHIRNFRDAREAFNVLPACGRWPG